MKIDTAPRWLTLDQLQDEIRRYKYRPGWHLDIYPDPWEGACLYVTMTVADAFNPGKDINLRVRSLIPPMATADEFGHWLLWRLMQVEIHECREFLHRDGKHLVNPHDIIEP